MVGKNKGTCKHYSGSTIKPLTEEQETLFNKDYSKFRKEFYRSSPYFSYD